MVWPGRGRGRVLGRTRNSVVSAGSDCSAGSTARRRAATFRRQGRGRGAFRPWRAPFGDGLPRAEAELESRRVRLRGGGAGPDRGRPGPRHGCAQGQQQERRPGLAWSRPNAWLALPVSHFRTSSSSLCHPFRRLSHPSTPHGRPRRPPIPAGVACSPVPVGGSGTPCETCETGSRSQVSARAGGGRLCRRGQPRGHDARPTEPPTRSSRDTSCGKCVACASTIAWLACC